MNEIEQLENELDIIYDKILAQLGDIPDCASKQMLINVIEFQNKTSMLFLKVISKNLENNHGNSIHSVSISEGSREDN